MTPDHANRHLRPRVALVSAGSWYLRQTGRVFQDHEALAGLYISDKNTTGIRSDLFHRCWAFHLVMKPFYHLLNRSVQRWSPIFYRALPIWNHWLERHDFSGADIVQAVGIFATEAFDLAERKGCLKVFDAPNSHPIIQRNILRDEYAKWNPHQNTPTELDRYCEQAQTNLRRADLILCPSGFVKESMLQQGIPEEKTVLAPFGVDTSVFTPRLCVPAIPVFITVGTICLRKGYQYLFRAFEILKKTLPEAQLIVVGIYRPDFALERKIWQGRFTHVPYLSHSQLAELFKTCTAFVMPSVEEGYARVILEAMAAGLPVIATHESGASTDIEHGKEGFIVPRGDPEQIAMYMQTLAQDRALNERMGQAAAGFSKRDISWEGYGRTLLQKFSELLASKASQAISAI